MGESEPRYNTEYNRDYYYKYRTKTEIPKFNMFYGNDKDMLFKTLQGLANGSYIGLGVASVMFIYDDAGFNLQRAIHRSFIHGYPWIFSGIAYGLTVGVAANIRDKADSVNHLLGGFAAGAMLGSCYKSLRVGATAAIVIGGLTGAVALAKEHDNNWVQGPFHRPRFLDLHRSGWFTERPDLEGDQSGNDAFRKYRPDIK